MAIETWSFCNHCEMYHIDWTKNNLDRRFETHLSKKDKEESYAFNVYQKEVNGLRGVVMVCANIEAMPEVIKMYPSGFIE